MINLHQAIYALNPSIITIRGDVAYDKNEQIVQYSMEQAQAKLIELQAKEDAKEKDIAAAKQSALSKLAKLGLTDDEVKALVG